MGGSLTQPITSKCSNQGEGLGLRYGLSSMQGWRSEMEDAHAVKIGLKYGLDKWSYFAVFDGHAGKRAASFAAWNLLEFILRDETFELETGNKSDHVYIEPEIDKFPNPSASSDGTEKPSQDSTQQNKKSDDTHDSERHKNEHVKTSKFISYPLAIQIAIVKDAIRSAFLRIDTTMRGPSQDMSGCTAVCALISPTYLFVANCGDSRAVLYDGYDISFATEDHKPYMPKERQRIIDAGGSATQRINGTLAVSRALGDFDFKKDELRGPCDQLVSPEPEVTAIQRQPYNKFLILACDGIWDVMTSIELCQYVMYLLGIEKNLENVCSAVLDLCLHKGSRDNMSIIIVVFEGAPKFSQAKYDQEKANDEKLKEFAESLEENPVDFEEFMEIVKESYEAGTFPAGGGIEAKWDLLREVYERKYYTNEEEQAND